MDKANLRKTMLNKRNELNSELVELAGEKLLQKLIDMDALRAESCIFTYVDMNNELSTHRILNYCFEHNIRVCVPKVVPDGNTKVMKPYLIDNLDSDLARGTFGVMEPTFSDEVAKTREVFINDIDVVLVPGLAFDEMGNRIGYGGGYYDKFFAQLHKKGKPLKVGICYDFQVIDKIQGENHDVPMDLVISISTLG